MRRKVSCVPDTVHVLWKKRYKRKWDDALWQFNLMSLGNT